MVANVTEEAYQAARGALNHDQNFVLPNQGMPANVDERLENIKDKNADATIAILWICFRFALRLAHRPGQVLVSCSCALGKQGNATPVFIIRGYQQDIGHPVDLDVEATDAC